MISKEIIEKNLHNTLDSTNLPFPKKKGKVRDIYDLGDKLLFVSTDRLSAFDRNLCTIPFKGAVLNLTSEFWFEKTKDIVKNHFLESPDPNVTIGKKLTIFPVEFVVRGYLSGSTSTSAWTAYEKGERLFCGHVLPEGLKKNSPFKEPLLTPTTKDDLHDEKISAKEILERKLMTKEHWEKASSLAIKLFERGTEIAKKNGLILVDTKYEFGYDEKGEIFLCDEIHTPDSSRFWIADTYEKNFSQSKEPENIDKEFLRRWFNENSDPYKDKILPEAPKELIIELSTRYQKLYEMITGKFFSVDTTKDVSKRLEENLRSKKYL